MHDQPISLEPEPNGQKPTETNAVTGRIGKMERAAGSVTRME